MKKLLKKFNVLWYSHPRMAIALMLVAVNLIVILVFTCILTIISEKPFFDSLAYLFTFTLSSDDVYNFVNNDGDNLLCFILKIILAIIQMVIFSQSCCSFS